MNNAHVLEKRLDWLLNGWEADILSAGEVHEFAEKWTTEYGHLELEREDPASAVYDVLSQLDILNHQFIIKSDILAIRQFIANSKDDPLVAWSRWDRYWGTINFEKRKSDLADSPYYNC